MKFFGGVDFALQSDQDSYDFAQEAQATGAPSWRNQVTMSSFDRFHSVLMMSQPTSAHGASGPDRLRDIGHELELRRLCVLGDHALFSGFVAITGMGVILTPLLHRLLPVDFSAHQGCLPCGNT